MTRNLTPVDQLSKSVNLSLIVHVGELSIDQKSCRSLFVRSVITAPEEVGEVGFRDEIYLRILYRDAAISFSSFSSSRTKSRNLDPGKPIYDLYAISNHSGTLSGGHYTAYCRHPQKTQNWHLYNDRGQCYKTFYGRKLRFNVIS